jgi:hypothetical protein
MLGVFLGAGFSKWAANLPLASELFDFDVQCRHTKEQRRLELLQQDKSKWDERNPGGTAEEFIEWCLDHAGERAARRVVWYVTRRLSDPFVARMLGGTQSLMIDDHRARKHAGVQNALQFLTRFIGLGIAGVVTSNYDLLVEYTYGTRTFHYGNPGEQLYGRGKNPWFPWQGVPVHLGGHLALAKVHGSVSWDESRRYTDGRCGLNGKALIVPPRPGKAAPENLAGTWRLAETILAATTRLVVFGFAFNSYDSNLLDLLRSAGSNVRQVLLVDPYPKMEAASSLWPDAQVLTMAPEFDYSLRATDIFSDTERRPTRACN